MSGIVSSVGLAALAVTGVSAAALGSYNVDPNSVSVSGMSSGGFFSVQLGIAYSSIFKTGFGVFAGGPFDCARNQLVSGHTLFREHLASPVYTAIWLLTITALPRGIFLLWQKLRALAGSLYKVEYSIMVYS